MQKFIFNSIIIVLLVTMPFRFCFGAFESYPRSTMNMGMGKITLNPSGNILGIFTDPGSLIDFGHEGGEAIWNKPFQIEELQQTAFAAGLLYRKWAFGISGSSFGNKIYNESIFAFTASRAFKDRLNYGCNIIFYQLRIDKYGTDNAFGLLASLRYNINETWNWVSTARNINLPKIGSSKENLPQVITTGFVGSINDKITIVTEWEQDIELKGALKFGIRVQPFDKLFLSAGYISNPGQFTAGLSIKINKSYFEYGTIAYTDLGLFTHQLGIGFNIIRH